MEKYRFTYAIFLGNFSNMSCLPEEQKNIELWVEQKDKFFSYFLHMDLVSIEM